MNSLNVIQSSEFLNIAINEAISVVAKVNNQTIEATAQAFASGNVKVMQAVAELVTSGAIEVAKHF